MPNSTFSRIKDILIEISKKDEPIDIFKLSEEIQSAEIESFAIWRKGPSPDTPIKSYCSPSSIRRLLRLANELELIKIGEKHRCTLTQIGENAITGDNYTTQLTAQLMYYLQSVAGVTFDEVEEIIKGIKYPESPYFEVIYHKIIAEKHLRISEKRFRSILYLLERCEILPTVTRKAYYPREV